jgi:hypothetical protein
MNFNTIWPRPLEGRHGTQHNDIQYSDTQHNDNQYNDTQHEGLKCDTQHK